MKVHFDARNCGPSVSHANSLDLVRIFAALCVLFSHQFALLGQPEPSFFGWQSFGGAGVSIFFFLSGALVSESWIRDPNLWRFFVRRGLRIFPALIAVVLLVAFVVGPLMTTLPLSSYLESDGTWRYLSTAALWVRHQLPGVFSDHPYPGVVNGSLWSLPLEFLCYVTLALVGVAGFLRQAGREIASGGAVLCLIVVVMSLLPEPLHVYFELAATFWFGVLFGSLRRFRAVSGSANLTLVALVLFSLVLYSLPGTRGFERVMMLLFSGGLVYLGMTQTVGSSLSNRIGDISYGLYIYAFPVQQLVVAAGRRYEWSFALHLIVSLVFTTLLAWISWHAIEKRALRYKPSSASKVSAPVMVGS